MKEIPAAIKAIERNIAYLHRLSNAIHKAGNDSRNIRAAQFIWKDEEGNDIGSFWKKHFALQLCERKYPDASPKIQDRMASAMLTRRKRLLYRQKRSEKLAVNTHRPQKKEVINVEKPQRPMQKQTAKEPGQAPSRNDTQLLPARSIRTFNTAATPLDPEKVHISSGASRVSTARSVPLDDETKFQIPPPPVMGRIEDVVCPYCCLVLPKQDLANLRWWT